MTKAHDLVAALVVTFEPWRGKELTGEVAGEMAHAATLLEPSIHPMLMRELLWPQVLRGHVVDTNLMYDRARAIATVAMFR